MSKKLYIQTNGCQMNAYDSAKIVDLLAQSHDFQVTQQLAEADLILLNTCSVREKAVDKMRSRLGEYNQIKQNNPNVIIGVGGCVASQEGANILKHTPFVDLVFGPQTLHRLPELYNQRLKTKRPVIDISFPEIEKFDCLPQPRAQGPCAFVSIMEGCSKYCSFCVVPYTRGEEINRPLDDVIAEVYALAQQKVREITLLGQNVNDYQGQMHGGGVADLAILIQYLAAIDGVDRIRFTTSHPLAFSDNLIQAYADVPELANHLHLPVQSGSDKILAAMKRGYTALEFKAKIRKLRQVKPDISITSDFIVGFPGETAEDFEKTMALVETIKFDNSYSFIYSHRPGTPAASLPDPIPMAEKKQRLHRLQQRLREFSAQRSHDLIGTQQRILITGPAKKNPSEYCGRTECNRIVNFPASKNLVGQFVNVTVTAATPNALRGRLTPVFHE